MGCGTAMVGYSLAPRAAACARAARWNSVEMTVAVGIPLSSKNTPSCTLHVVHDPQSARASMTASLVLRISARRSSGAGRAKVGLRLRMITLGLGDIEEGDRLAVEGAEASGGLAGHGDGIGWVHELFGGHVELLLRASLAQERRERAARVRLIRSSA